jgi:2,3-bisphosphoglycerate-dependent phosphoglycerate mutase
MELLLIRHARPFRVERDDGPADPSLDQVGLRQADLLAGWLATESVDALYTSPLVRARETVAPLAVHLGIEPVVEEGIAEWDRDAPVYIPIEELKATNHPSWDAMASGNWSELGIDPEIFVERVVGSIDAIAGRHPSERVALVCHGGVVNVYVAHLLGLDTLLFFEPAYTSISRVLVSREGVRSLRSLNETGHLRET